MPFRGLLAWLVIALAAPASAAPRVIERVLAVVDGRPVLLSELRLARQVRGEDAGPALEALIDEHLMFAEALRLPQAALTDAEEAKALASHSARTRTRAFTELAQTTWALLSAEPRSLTPRTRE